MADALPREAEVAVVGAGAMGAGIAQIAAQAGHRVQLFDKRMGAADQAKPRSAKRWRSSRRKASSTRADADAATARITPVHALGDLVSAKLVVEAIVEDLDAKRKLFRELEVVVAPEAVLASNTSSLSITSLAAGMKHPGRVVGMHFFNPAPRVAAGRGRERTRTQSATAAELVYETAKAWGKIPVHATSTPGFIVNRCARPFYGEALRLLTECAADPATIDAVMREAGGFRMGPFELMDLIGHDVNLAVTRSVWDAYFHDPRFAPSVLQQELVAAGHLGRKSGRGFYVYEHECAEALAADGSAAAAARAHSRRRRRSRDWRPARPSRRVGIRGGAGCRRCGDRAELSLVDDDVRSSPATAAPRPRSPWPAVSRTSSFSISRTITAAARALPSRAPIRAATRPPRPQSARCRQRASPFPASTTSPASSSCAP